MNKWHDIDFNAPTRCHGFYEKSKQVAYEHF